MAEEKKSNEDIIRYYIAIECIAQKYNNNTMAIFCKINNLEMNGLYNEFRGSMDWLSKRCNVTRSTASKIVKTLLKDNLLIDSTPEKDKHKITSVKHYIVNSVELARLSKEMNIQVDEATTEIRLKNKTKKELLLKNNTEKYSEENIVSSSTSNLFQNIDSYENPFEDDDD